MRKIYAERAAFTLAALHHQASTVAIDDMFGDGEAQASSAASLSLDPIEAFRQPWQMLARYTRAIVRHSQDDKAPAVIGVW